MVGAWNALPGRVVEADTLTSFKTYLDSHMSSLGMEGYKTIGLARPRSGHRLGGPKGLFPVLYCSLFFDFYPCLVNIDPSPILVDVVPLLESSSIHCFYHLVSYPNVQFFFTS